MKKTIPYGHQWIDEKDIKEVGLALRSDWITQGPKVEEFEEKVSKFSGAKYGVAVSSGTTALQLAYTAAGLGPRDEVITTPLTFVATSNAFVVLGAKPVFADVKEESLNIDPKEIEKKITKKTRALAVVDFAGFPCQYDEILKIAKKHNLLIIEDASHALGSIYKGKRIGSIADMTILSFHPVKTITTGEGGMVLTNNKEFYESLKVLRHHSILKKPQKGTWYYEIEEPGYNFRLTDFQAALGISQLQKLNKFIQRRREIVRKYNRAFGHIQEIITPPLEPKGVKAAWHIYVIQLVLEKLKADRKKIFEDLHKEGIMVQVHYIPLHFQPFYKKKFGFKRGDFPKTENYYERAITLPLFPKMTNKEVEKVIETVKKIINYYRL